jgi:tetratricopeptide (TPR) repeat protein
MSAEWRAVPIEVGSKGNPNFIEVRHGKMLISVPRSIFKGRTSAFKEAEAIEFKRVLASRYPWLSANAVEMVIQEARETMESLLDMERGAVERARRILDEGRPTQALELLEEHLEMEPRDQDAWYLRGEILFKIGRQEEGFACFSRARNASKPVDPRRSTE